MGINLYRNSIAYWFLIITFCMFSGSVPAVGQVWVEGTFFGVPVGNAKGPIAINVWGDCSADTPTGACVKDQWHTIDLSGPAFNLPADTKAVILSGRHIITHSGSSTCDNWANFRAPGDGLNMGNYQTQTIEAHTGGGQRTNAAVIVPVVDRKFEFAWHHTPPCLSAINFSVQGYVR